MNFFAHYLVMQHGLVLIDGSIFRAHQHSCGARTADNESIGKSRGGTSTKIHLTVGSEGLPVYYELSCGNMHDIVHTESLVANCPTSNVVVADKGYNRKWQMRSRLAFFLFFGCSK